MIVAPLVLRRTDGAHTPVATIAAALALAVPGEVFDATDRLVFAIDHHGRAWDGDDLVGVAS